MRKSESERGSDGRDAQSRAGEKDRRRPTEGLYIAFPRTNNSRDSIPFPSSTIAPPAVTTHPPSARLLRAVSKNARKNREGEHARSVSSANFPRAQRINDIGLKIIDTGVTLGEEG